MKRLSIAIWIVVFCAYVKGNDELEEPINLSFLGSRIYGEPNFDSGKFQDDFCWTFN